MCVCVCVVLLAPLLRRQLPRRWHACPPRLPPRLARTVCRAFTRRARCTAAHTPCCTPAHGSAHTRAATRAHCRLHAAARRARCRAYAHHRTRTYSLLHTATVHTRGWFTHARRTAAQRYVAAPHGFEKKENAVCGLVWFTTYIYIYRVSHSTVPFCLVAVAACPTLIHHLHHHRRGTRFTFTNVPVVMAQNGGRGTVGFATGSLPPPRGGPVSSPYRLHRRRVLPLVSCDGSGLLRLPDVSPVASRTTAPHRALATGGLGLHLHNLSRRIHRLATHARSAACCCAPADYATDITCCTAYSYPTPPLSVTFLLVWFSYAPTATSFTRLRLAHRLTARRALPALYFITVHGRTLQLHHYYRFHPDSTLYSF